MHCFKFENLTWSSIPFCNWYRQQDGPNGAFTDLRTFSQYLFFLRRRNLWKYLQNSWMLPSIPLSASTLTKSELELGVFIYQWHKKRWERTRAQFIVRDTSAVNSKYSSISPVVYISIPIQKVLRSHPLLPWEDTWMLLASHPGFFTRVLAVCRTYSEIE